MCVLLRFLYRSHVTPNYPDVTDVARRLFQANSRDFPKIYRSVLVKLAAERLQRCTRNSAYELPIPPVRLVQLRPTIRPSRPRAGLRVAYRVSNREA